jgi:pyruvate-ferredoxin/flavodoxin oxidoreductase
LLRPFSVEDCLSAIPATVTNIAVLDRTKEPGAIGEPLYMDISAAIAKAWHLHHATPAPQLFGGRYGLSSKEFTPYHASAVFNAIQSRSIFHGFTVGITDDVSYLSLSVAKQGWLESQEAQMCALFYGRGSDGTVGANKNTIKIVTKNSPLFSQGYFVYDSKKSGGMTTSHLRFDSSPIDAPYLIDKADFIGCHQQNLLANEDILSKAKVGATLLFNSATPALEIWETLGAREKSHIINKQLELYCIDASAIANQCGIKGRINNIMQRAFFLLSDLIDDKLALEQQRKAITQTYQSKGIKVVEANLNAVELTESAVHKVVVPGTPTAQLHTMESPCYSSGFNQQVIEQLIRNRGDSLPVSAFPVDGQWPTATSQMEKRDIASFVPRWNSAHCTQCNVCSLVCPHAAIRTKVIKQQTPIDDAPNSFEVCDYKLKDFKGERYTLQVSPKDCTGCQLCVEMCPANSSDASEDNALHMVARSDINPVQQHNFDYFTSLPELKPIDIKRIDARSSQLLEPLFEFSGACSGCGETPYIKLLTQLFGDHMMVANATGCSSIYSGNLPTTPYTCNDNGQGPAWSNSLFEDNAEFGLGMRLAVDSEQQHALRQLTQLGAAVPGELVDNIEALIGNTTHTAVEQQRANIDVLKEHLPEDHPINAVLDALVSKSIWIVGGDGWAYDIGYGGIDHVLSSDKNINIIVLNNQVYANTGGQQSKATPTGAIAKFASEGKQGSGKDLGVMTMMQGNAYVATIAMSANMNQTVKAIQEAEAFPGPSLIIAYASCITHGINMADGSHHQQQLVNSGLWPLYRYNPQRKAKGKSPLQLDSRPAKQGVEEFVELQNRFKQLSSMDNESYQALSASLQEQVERKQALLEQLSELK